MDQPAAPVKMLVVDDELRICDFLKGFFTTKGYEVFSATSGEEALAQMPAIHPQIVLLDVRMPGISGLDALSKIKALAPETKVIMVTALDDDALMAEARSRGAADYITKPFSFDYLEGAVLRKLGHPGA